MGSELTGKVLGVVGFGRIGREVARWCAAFGMTVVAYDPVMSVDAISGLGATPVTLEELFSRSDYITLHAPNTPDTKNLLCTATLAK
jgi:phosphoglycerate dehydrogenase-like enzyme